MKKLKISAYLDMVYACCFFMVFFIILIFTETTDHHYAIFVLTEPGNEDLTTQLFGFLMLPAYAGGVVGAIELVLALKKLKNINGLEEKLKDATGGERRRFVKGYRLNLLAHFVYLGVVIAIIAQGVGSIDIILCVIFMVLAYIVGLVSKMMRKQYVKGIKEAEAMQKANLEANKEANANIKAKETSEVKIEENAPSE